jgi:hypothetical protein
MLFKKKNQTQVKDERIEKETNKLMTPMFYLFSAGLLACLVIKLVLGEPWYNFVLEIACLVPAWGYALIKRAQSGILVMKEKDEVLPSIRDAIHSKAFMISFWVILAGELIYMFDATNMLNPDMGNRPDAEIWTREMTWMCVYLTVWLVPAIIVTVNTLKKGWMIWGSKKQETVGKKAFAKRVVVGALFFGLIMGVPELIANGFFYVKGWLMIFGMAAMWGILFYFGMLGMIKLSEKKADKLVQEKEESNEE